MLTTLGTGTEVGNCKSCGDAFSFTRSGKGRPPQYCSAACRAERDKAQKAAYQRRRAAGVRINTKPCRNPVMVTVTCEHCGVIADKERHSTGNRFCSTKCREDYHWQLRKAEPQGERNCKACGKAFEAKGKAHHYCSDDCRYRVWYPQKRARRKAQMVGVVDPIKVMERDDWTCRLCGKAAPRFLRGKMHPMAPELDHIIPLAAGGQHTYENTQCAHRSCNMAKGAKPLGQLLLIG